MSKFSLLLSVSVLFGTIDACQPTSRQEMSIERSKNGINTLKSEGYYYRKVHQSNGLRIRFFILYKNGVVYGPTNLVATQLEGTNATVLRHFEEVNYSLSAHPPYFWGIYNERDSIVTLEVWTGSNGGPYPTKRYVGQILNDETIFFEDSYLDTMRFMPLEEKPDSTNPFVPYEDVQKRKKAIRYEHN